VASAPQRRATEDLATPRAAADAALDRGELSAETLALIEELMAQEPGDAGWPVAAGRCLAALGRLDEAAAAFAAAPASPVVASQREKLRLRMRIRDRAERLFADDPWKLREAADAARDADADHAFQVEARWVLAANEPGGVAALCALGAAQRHDGAPHVAWETYDRAWALERSESDTAMVQVGRAGVLRDLGRVEEARALYDTVLAAHPHDTYALLGSAALRLDDVEKHGAGPRALDEARALLRGITGEWGPRVWFVYRRWERLSRDA
jgi:tetratricopeptide (TPR) repeat protein